MSTSPSEAPPSRPGTGLQAALFAERGTARRVLVTIAGLLAFLAFAELFWERPWVGLEDGLRDPVRYAGSQVLHGPVRVLEADAGGFVVRTVRGMRVRVEAQPGLVQPGDEVVYRGTILANGHLALLREGGRTFLRHSPRGIQKRVAMYAVSFAVLGYVAWRLRVSFVFRDGRVDVRSPRG